MKDKMLSRVKPLVVNGRKATGKLVSNLSECIVDRLNKQKKLNMKEIYG